MKKNLAGNNSPLQAIQELARAWIQKDAAGMSEHLSDDIVEIGPAYTEPLKGKKHFFSKYRAYLESPLQILSYKILQPHTVMLSEREELVYFKYRMRTSLEGQTEDSRGKESMLVRRIRGRWRVRFIHWHRDA
jgi:hypothetical protein